MLLLNLGAVLDGKFEKAASAIETAAAAIAAAEQQQQQVQPAMSRLVLTSLHVLYAHVLLAQGQREAAVDRCLVLASTDMDFNIVYRCILPMLPLPVPRDDAPAFTLDEIDTLM
jgi:CII-binding regulator of phage lambda lysogenization HflD|eukprot:COSAG06_NODE_6238_length_3023_cov_10.992134_2_plen_114_part_00